MNYCTYWAGIATELLRAVGYLLHARFRIVKSFSSNVAQMCEVCTETRISYKESHISITR